MHELSVAQSILRIAVENAEKAHADRITGINLVIGQLSSIVDNSIQFYWNIISADTIASDAKISINRIPVEMRCFDCGHNFSPGNETFDCPNCNSVRVQVTHGNEMTIESIDVE